MLGGGRQAPSLLAPRMTVSRTFWLISMAPQQDGPGPAVAFGRLDDAAILAGHAGEEAVGTRLLVRVRSIA